MLDVWRVKNFVFPVLWPFSDSNLKPLATKSDQLWAVEPVTA